MQYVKDWPGSDPRLALLTWLIPNQPRMQGRVAVEVLKIFYILAPVCLVPWSLHYFQVLVPANFSLLTVSLICASAKGIIWHCECIHAQCFPFLFLSPHFNKLWYIPHHPVELLLTQLIKQGINGCHSTWKPLFIGLYVIVIHMHTLVLGYVDTQHLTKQSPILIM